MHAGCRFGRVVCSLLLVASVAFPAGLSMRSQSRARAISGVGWTILPVSGQVPPPRSQYGMAADAAGDVYIYGGSGAGGTALSDFWVLRATHDAWQELANPLVPALIEPHLAVDASGDVFEFGGIGSAAGAHFSADGHSFGLYEYRPVGGAWADLTPAGAQPGVTWPAGREDFGLAFDLSQSLLYVFAGEGNADTALNDLWRYDPSTATWSRIDQRYHAPGGGIIDPREIYNISYDNHGGFYLFGGSYLSSPAGAATPPLYVNDLWRFDIASATWTLLGGTPNGYDPALPLPRHYYGQACDEAGNFYLLDGYVSDTSTLPYFRDDLDATAASMVTLDGALSDSFVAYGIADFWQYRYSTDTRQSAGGARATATTGQWQNLTDHLGALFAQPAIPYVMVLDRRDDQLLTYGGFHPDGSTLTRSSATWVYGLPPPASGTPPPMGIASASPEPTASAAATRPPSPAAQPSRVATTAAPALPTITPTVVHGAPPSSTPTSSPTAATTLPPELQPADPANPPHP